MSRGYVYEAGTKLLVELVYGEKYAGNVRDCEEDQITLLKVYDYMTQTEGKSNDARYFFRIEIRNITVLEEVHKAPSDEPPPTYYKIHREKIHNLIHNFIYMTKKNRSFYNAMECIKTSNVISIAALVPHFGKGLYLTLLGVGTPEQVFLFDLKLIGSTAFDYGLREVLESNHVLKVVHIANKLAESLLDNHFVSLRNVFDTQVADLTVSFRANSTVSPRPRNLNECLWFYFNVPHHIISSFSFNLMRVHSRPLAENFKISMATQVVYLLRLQRHLKQQIAVGYSDALKHFMNFRRQGTLGDSWKMGTRNTAKKLRDFKPKALERKPLFVTGGKLTVKLRGTRQATSTDDQVAKMSQALTPLSLDDKKTGYESAESFPESNKSYNGRCY